MLILPTHPVHWIANPFLEGKILQLLPRILGHPSKTAGTGAGGHNGTWCSVQCCVSPFTRRCARRKSPSSRWYMTLSCVGRAWKDMRSTSFLNLQMCTPYLSSWYQNSFQIAEVKWRLVYVAMLAVLRTMSVDHPSPKVSDLALAKGKPTTRMMTSGVLSFSSENCAAFGYINLSQNRHVKMRQPPGSHWWHCELLMVALFRLKKTSEMWTKEMLFRCRRLPGSWFPLKVKEYHDLRNKPTQSAYDLPVVNGP